jgi:hypothetical protein
MSGLDQDLLSGVKWGAVNDTAVEATPSDESLLSKPRVFSRPMSNLLRPFGVPYKAYRKKHETLIPHAPDAQFEPMPPWAGSWIRTAKGVLRLLSDELCRGIGVPKRWGDLESLPGHLISNATSLHIWESIAPAVALLNTSGPRGTPTPQHQPSDEVQSTSDPVFTSEPMEWTWSVPNIVSGSEWHISRIYNLLHACKGLPNRSQLFDEGLKALDIHRQTMVLRALQLLWWEFPHEHWHDLRHGCPMNFLQPPKPGITLNLPMTDEQKLTAIEFVEEPCQLAVLQPAEPGEVLTNCPLFILPKPGQPGQWRVLADMKKGGQNEGVIGKDPIYLNRPSTVLPHMYSGGWSAVGDASKCF